MSHAAFCFRAVPLRHAAHPDMKCSFVAWVGKPSSRTKKAFLRLKMVFQKSIFLFCFCVAVGSHVACQSLREAWQFLKWALWQKSNSQALEGCEGHLFATSDPTSCSCPHPSAPPRPQPSPRSWHRDFLQHFSPASFLLSTLKGKEKFTPWIWNVYIFKTNAPQNFLTSNLSGKEV